MICHQEKGCMNKIVIKMLPVVVVVIIFWGMILGCSDNYVKVESVKQVLAEIETNNYKANFTEKYDISMSPQLIAESDSNKGFFTGCNAELDKLGNIFIFWFNENNSWFYTPGITSTIHAFNNFQAGNNRIYEPFICKDSENNFVFFDLQNIPVDVKNRGAKWKILRILKWDGKDFSELHNTLLPKSTGNAIFNPFYAEYPDAEINFIRSDANLKKNLVIGSFYEEYMDFSSHSLKNTYQKTFLALWELDSDRWKVCERVARAGRFSAKDTDLAINKSGNIYAVWSEDAHRNNSTNNRIFFDVFDNEKWQGNHLISGDIPLNCEYPHIATDEMNNCHVVWSGVKAYDSEKHYYRKYSNSLEWSDIEEIPLGNYKPWQIYLTIMDNNLFIYWYEKNSICFKIRVASKLWSETYQINLGSSISKIKMLFDDSKDIHIIWETTSYEDGMIRIYYKKLVCKK